MATAVRIAGTDFFGKSIYSAVSSEALEPTVNGSEVITPMLSTSAPLAAQARSLLLDEGVLGDASPTFLQATDLLHGDESSDMILGDASPTFLQATDLLHGYASSDMILADASPTFLQAPDPSQKTDRSSFVFRFTNNSFLDSFAELRKKIQREESISTSQSFDNITDKTTELVSTRQLDDKLITPDALSSNTDMLTTQAPNVSITHDMEDSGSPDLLLDTRLLLSQMLAKKQGYASNATSYHDQVMSGSRHPVYLESQVNINNL